MFGMTEQQLNECLWGDCGEPLPPDMEPGSLASALALAEHLLNDHLNTDDLDLSNLGAGPSAFPNPRNGPPPLSLPSSVMGTGDEHVCEWEHCGQSFPSSADLMQHITSVHVGSGKNEYWCAWQGCERHTERRSFSSKQKILRHMQVRLYLILIFHMY